MLFTSVPVNFGSGGSGLPPKGSAVPTLRTLLEEHRAGLAAMQEAAGANLANADATVTVSQGRWRKLIAGTLTANRAITLGTTGAVAGDQIEFTRLDVEAFTLAFINGGAGAGTLLTLPVSKLGCAKFQFDGTNWALRSFGMQP